MNAVELAIAVGYGFTLLAFLALLLIAVWSSPDRGIHDEPE